MFNKKSKQSILVIDLNYPFISNQLHSHMGNLQTRVLAYFVINIKFIACRPSTFRMTSVLSICPCLQGIFNWLACGLTYIIFWANKPRFGWDLPHVCAIVESSRQSISVKSSPI